MSEETRREGEFLLLVADLEDELEDARANKADDPERWDEVKHRFAELRTTLKQLDRPAGVDSYVSVETAPAAADAKNVGG